MNEKASIEYGSDPNFTTALFDEVRAAIAQFGKQRLALQIGISRNSLTKILDARCQNLSPRLSQKMGAAIAALNCEAIQEKMLLELAAAEVAAIGLSEFARQLEINKSNLNKVTDGKRKLTRQLVAKFERYFEGR